LTHALAWQDAVEALGAENCYLSRQQHSESWDFTLSDYVYNTSGTDGIDTPVAGKPIKLSDVRAVLPCHKYILCVSVTEISGVQPTWSIPNEHGTIEFCLA
jgi:hypothetical protein